MFLNNCQISRFRLWMTPSRLFVYFAAPFSCFVSRGLLLCTMVLHSGRAAAYRVNYTARRRKKTNARETMVPLKVCL